jgi:hypothetical protein
MTIYYSNEGKYRLIDFNESHSEILIRKYKTNQDDFNTDILFKGVYSLNIAVCYEGFKIEVVEKQKGQISKLFHIPHFTFRISDNNKVVSFIDAVAVGIFNNTLDYPVSSLGDFTWSKENKNIYWYPEKERDNPSIDMYK